MIQPAIDVEKLRKKLSETKNKHSNKVKMVTQP